MNWLLKLIGGTVGEKALDFFVKRQELKNELRIKKLEGKIAVEQAKADAAIKHQEHLASWEMAQLANSGFKDEIVLFVLLVPYVGSFIPVVQDYIFVGFQYLERMPYWAVGLTVTIFLAIYGIRHRNATRIAAPGLRDRDVKSVEPAK